MPATVTAVIGTQFGDEGKGCVIDVLAEAADVVARFFGGSNAGHTVVVNGVKYVFHLLPSAILRPGVHCHLGQGVAVDPVILWGEITNLETPGEKRVENVRSRITISNAAPVVMPYHKILDVVEEILRGANALGTTKKGIGPCSANLAARTAIRICDLIDRQRLREGLERNIPLVNWRIKQIRRPFRKLPDGVPRKPLSVGQVFADIWPYAEALRDLVVDGRQWIQEQLRGGARILLEGAQSPFLGLHDGSYPFVTSSEPTAAGACLGSSIGPLSLERVIGVAKAYTTRVGEGPFPSEDKGADGKRLRERGGEYGATTNRPRDCGWYDVPMVRTAVQFNNIKAFAINKLDVLDDFETIKVAVAYELDGKPIQHVPSDTAALARCRPIYREFQGWQQSTTEIRDWASLPDRAREYLEFIENEVGASIMMVGVGAGRESHFVR